MRLADINRWVANRSGQGTPHNIGIKGQSKIHKVMGEFKRKTLKSSSGAKITSRKQAVAIALSEAREAGARIPKKKG